MLNPDTELQKDSVNLLINFAKNIADNVLISPCLLNSDGTFQKSFWKVPTAFDIFLEIFFYNYILSLFFHNKFLLCEKQVDCVSGAAMLFHRTLLSEVGYFDPDLFWMEDTEFCYRIYLKKGKVFYFPSAKVIHHVGKSSAKNQNIKVSNQILSKIKFFKKYNLYFSFVFSIIFSLVLLIEKITLFLILCPFKLPRNKLIAYLYAFKKLMIYFVQ